MTRPRTTARKQPIRVHDRVVVGGTGKPWRVLNVDRGLAHLRSMSAYPTVEWRDLPVDRLSHTGDLA